MDRRLEPRPANRPSHIIYIIGLLLQNMVTALLRKPIIDILHAIRFRCRTTLADISGHRRRAVNAYLSTTSVPRLHVGCGHHPLKNWLNCDYNPSMPEILAADASDLRFVPSESFLYVFSEHLSEHLDTQAADKFLAECFRVLKPGGILRVATPNLSYFCRMIIDPSPFDADYLDFDQRRNGAHATPVADTFNRMMRNWGHTYIYDEAALTWYMHRRGFEQVSSRQALQSDHEFLRYLENTGRKPSDFIARETLILEGRRPS